jgi:DNA-binding MarR family transcriptional regulator
MNKLQDQVEGQARTEPLRVGSNQAKTPPAEPSPSEPPPAEPPLSEPPWDNPRFRNWVAVARACHVLERTLAARLAPLDLKPAQLDVLMNLHRHPGMSQHDLARKLLVGRSSVTMLLPQLETRGLLRREGDEKDKRILRLSLTDAGETLLTKALRVHTALIELAMSQSTPQECDLIGEQMRRIADVLKDG